jgi:hypothetical protein
LRADQSFGTVSSGFVGTPSDGLVQLDSAHTLTPSDSALGGNVEQTAQVRFDKHGDAMLALGFGTTQAWRRCHGRRHGRPAVRVAARPVPVGVAVVRRRA